MTDVKKKAASLGRSLAALFLAFSLVLTASYGGAVGPVGVVSAEHQTCSEVDEFFWVLSIGLLNDHCDSSELSEYVTQLEDSKQDATKTEIYNTGQQVDADTEQYLGVTGNYLADSGTPAMAKAEAAAIAEIDANGSRSEVKTAASNAVADYYTVRQMNLADQYGVTVETVYTMENTSDVAGISEDFVSVRTDDYSTWHDGAPYPLHPTGTSDVQVTTVNGTQILTKGLYIEWPTGDGYADGSTIVDVTETHEDMHDSTEELNFVRVGPIDGQTSYQVLNFSDYGTEWSNIQSKNTQMEANAEAYADALYNETVEGNGSTSDYISGATASQEFSTDYESTGYYSYAVGWAAANGMAFPELGNSSLMTISTTTDEYQGLILSQNPPSSGVWEVDKTYNADNILGDQFVATVDHGVVELDGEFVITSMEDMDGNPVESTTVEEVDYTVTNETSSYAETQEELRELRAQIEQLDPPGGGGSTGGSGWSLGDLTTTQMVLIIAGVAAVLLARDGM